MSQSTTIPRPVFDEHAIDTGFRRLTAWLAPRGLHLAFYGLYPTLEDEDRCSLDLAW